MAQPLLLCRAEQPISSAVLLAAPSAAPQGSACRQPRLLLSLQFVRCWLNACHSARRWQRRIISAHGSTSSKRASGGCGPLAPRAPRRVGQPWSRDRYRGREQGRAPGASSLTRESLALSRGDATILFRQPQLAARVSLSQDNATLRFRQRQAGHASRSPHPKAMTAHESLALCA